MRPEKFPHILLRDITRKQSYTPKTGGGSSEGPVQEKDPDVHGEFLKHAYDLALEKHRHLCRQNGITEEVRLDEGFTVEVKAPENVGLEYTKLEDKRGREHLEVPNVRVDEKGNVSSAVIYIPPRKKENFSRKIEDYQDESKKTEKGRRKNQKLLDTVEDIAAADMERNCRRIPEVGAVCLNGHVRICTGGVGQPTALPRYDYRHLLDMWL